MTISVSHCLLVNWAIILAFLSQQLPSKDNTNGFHDPLSQRFARYKSCSSRCISNHQRRNRSVFDWPLIVRPTLITDLSLQTTRVRERVTVRSRFDLETLVTRLSKEPATFQQDNLWQATEETKRENEAGSEVERYAFYQPTTILISIISQY